MLTIRPLTPALDRLFSLDRELDRAIGDSISRSQSVWYPSTDVIEKSSGYVIALELPGVHPGNVEVTFEQNVLTVRGAKSPTVAPEEESELRIFTAERVSGAFERSFRMPEHVDGNAIEARFDTGVLVINVPKKPASQPRKIPINASQPAIAG